MSKEHRFLVAYQVRRKAGFTVARIFVNAESQSLSRATILALESHLAALDKVDTNSVFVTGVSYLGKMTDAEFTKESAFSADDAMPG